MRILHFGKYAFERTGGIERHVEVLARAQAAQGADVTVLSYASGHDSRPRQVDGVWVEPVPPLVRLSSQPVAPALVTQARRLVRGGDFDVVHQHWPDPLAHVAASLMGTKAVQVVSWHSDIVKQRVLGPVYRWIAPRFLCRPDAVIGATHTHLRSLQLDIFADEDRRHVIPYGIDNSSLMETPELLARVRNMRGRYQGKPLIFALGRHVYYKGFEVLIRAMTHVPATLLLGGAGPMTPELMKLADSLAPSSQGQVVFAGSIPEDELPVYYHACDVFCLPSVATTEAFGLVQAEAMACGKPIVNTLLGTGVNEVAPDGVCARTVTPGDQEALAGALREMIENPSIARALGEQGRERVASLYNVDVMARKTLALYAQVLSEA